MLSSSSAGGPVGDLSRKTTTYDIWSLLPSSSGGGSNGDHHHPHVGAEELNSLSVLLPCKRKGGKLFLGAYLAFAFLFFCPHAPLIPVAPKPVTRHLVVTARPAEPTRSGPASDPAMFQNPAREAYPAEALAHRFRPYGDPGDPPPPPPPEDDKHGEEREKEKVRRKKRRGGEAVSAESPKKAKKAKTTA